MSRALLFLQHFPAALCLAGLLWWGLWSFPAALRLDGLLVVGPVGFPGGAAPGRATGGGACGVSRRRCAWTGYWWCGLRVSRRHCAWPGY
ncbi:hypothetical protein ACOTAG_001907 [Klebsiella aerogenes]